MEDELKLYPFKMLPIDETEGECVQVADLGWQDSVVRNGWLAANTVSEIMEMYMDRVVGEKTFAEFGRQFPLLVKFMDVPGKRTPLMVCPDDTVAAERYDFLGKAKLWYVKDAGPHARLGVGFAGDVEAADFYSACRHGEVEPLLRIFKPQVGEFHYIRPGQVHFAEDVTLVEVAESSPLDFRLFNWGKPVPGDEFDASLNLEAAFDFIDYSASVASGVAGASDGSGASGTFSASGISAASSASDAVGASETPGAFGTSAAPGISGATAVAGICREFTVKRMDAEALTGTVPGKADSYKIYTCLNGSFSIQASAASGTKEKVRVQARESVIVPAEVQDYVVDPGSEDTIALEITSNTGSTSLEN